MNVNPRSEQWRDIPGYEGFYQVSDAGRIKSFQRDQIRILTPSAAGKGYLTFHLYKNGCRETRTVHRTVLLSFLGKPINGQESRHLDGNKQNNQLPNLRWGTSSENEIDKYEHGTDKRGTNHHNVRLTDDDVREIRSMSGTQQSIATQFGISQAHVNKIILRKRWKHI